MEFSKKKLPRESAPQMQKYSIQDIAPFTPLFAPGYVFMPRNAKFVSVKAPLDFFTPEELKKLDGFRNIYFSEFLDEIEPFRVAARAVRAILNWKPRIVREKGVRFAAPELPPAPFELSDAILRVMGPLWGPEMRIEPFFLAVFAQELFGNLATEKMAWARDQSYEVYERALLISSAMVFLELHVGKCSLSYLKKLRIEQFEQISKNPSEKTSQWIHLKSLDSSQWSRLTYEKSNGCRQLLSRLARVANEGMAQDREISSVYGPRGFRNE